MAALEQALADQAIKAEAAEVIRSQIGRITLTLNEAGTLDAQLYGDLAQFLELCEGGERNTKAPAVLGRGVDCRWLRGQDLDFVHFL